MTGDRDAVRALLKQGADVNGAQGDGMTRAPLGRRTRRRRDGRDARLRRRERRRRRRASGSTRRCTWPARRAARRSPRRCSRQARTWPRRTTTTGVTPLHLAAASGNAEVVTIAARPRRRPNAKEAEWGQTPLIFAAAQNRADGDPRAARARRRPDVSRRRRSTSRSRARWIVPRPSASGRCSRRRCRKGQQADREPDPGGDARPSRELFASGKIPPPDTKEGAAANDRNAPGRRE